MLRGHIDLATRQRVVGWVQDPDEPERPVSLLVTVDDELAARVLANGYRADLEKAGVGSGRHGFDAVLRHGVPPGARCTLAVLREETGEHCPGSPVPLDVAARFDQAVQEDLSALLSACDTEEELQQRLEFLARQTERLLQARADRRSRRSERLARRQFRWRWAPDMPAAAGEGPLGPGLLPLRALVIDETMPALGRDAGSNAVLSHMRSLQRLGYEITFAAADMAPAGDPGMLDALEIGACCLPWHASVEEVLRREAGSFDVVYLHRVAVATRYLGLVRHHMPRARVIFSVADLHHVRLARQAEVEQRPELAALARRLRSAEFGAALAADAVITHSTWEATLLRRHIPAARVHIVPWSVPPDPTPVPFAERHGVAFLANYAHPPNLDAALRLADEIMPLVRRQNPAISCLLVGSAMPAVLRRERPGVTPLGDVSTLRAVFDRVRVTTAPLTYGAGVKGKVLDSLAAGVPCICSPVAAEGIELPSALQALIAADAPGLAALIVRLHGDEALNARCGEAGLAYVTEQLSEDRLDGLMRDVAGLPGAYPSPEPRQQSREPAAIASPASLRAVPGGGLLAGNG